MLNVSLIIAIIVLPILAMLVFNGNSYLLEIVSKDLISSSNAISNNFSQLLNDYSSYLSRITQDEALIKILSENPKDLQ
jgi:hypothetical protein